MKTVRLGAIAESLPCDYGDDPTDEAPAFDVVKVSNVSGDGQFHGDFEKRRFRDNQLANLLVKEGELLVVKSSGSKANILSGKTAICGEDRAGRIVASNFLLRLRVDEAAAVPRFLWYVLNSGASKAFVKTIVGASTYPNLKWSLYASHPIPLPPLAEQRRIAEVLDRAEALRAKRRSTLAQLDSLTQSLFLDLFGDPVSNPKRWPRHRLGEVAQKITDGEHLNPEFSTSGMPIVMAGNVLDERIDLDNAKSVEWELGKRFRKKCDPEPGDLLLVSRGATIGRQCVVGSAHDFCLMGSVILIKPSKERVDSRFLSTFLRHPVSQSALYRTSGSSAQQAIYLKDLQNLNCVLPPIDLQHEFARQVTAVEKLKMAQRASLAELDALFATLQHRAFRGEL